MLKLTKWAIWLYLFLLIFEGAFRKWILPGAADIFLIIRDPVVLAIYFGALASGIVPRSAFLAVLAGLALASLAFSFLGGQTNLLVTAYGIRTNYLHVPLIWVMAAVLDRNDVERLGSFVLLMAIPMTLVMIRQFQSPIDSPINRGVGGDETGGQIYGALGRIRPPGFFSFITGPMVYFPLAAAFFLHQASTGRRLYWWLVAICGLCVIIALPVSISRGTMITTGLVGVAFAFCMIRIGVINVSAVRFAALGVVVLVALSFLPFFKEAQHVFMDRWDTAKEEAHGDAWGSLTSRVTAVFSEPLHYAAEAPFFGYGIGVGSNVGARLLAGRVGFLLAEDEWGKSFLELGPILGGAFILFRVVLTLYLGLVAWQALTTYRDPLPMLILAAAAPVIMLHQWAPPTLLGFAVFGGGLIMAALNYVEEEEEEDEDEFDEDSDGDEENEHDEQEEDEAPLSAHELRRRRMRGL
jgi:hypothetical protein